VAEVAARLVLEAAEVAHSGAGEVEPEMVEVEACHETSVAAVQSTSRPLLTTQQLGAVEREASTEA
jgi:hypothetical protein